MTKKIIVYINEPLEEMALGRNTTLAYICSCIQKGYDVYVHNLPATGKIVSDEVDAVLLNQENAGSLIEEYKKCNRAIKDVIDNHNASVRSLLAIKPQLVENSISPLPKIKFKTQDADFVIQRLEPMKAPFPPAGKENIDEIFLQIKNLYPNHFVFNFPIAKGDKDLPLILDLDAQQRSTGLATPTIAFSLENQASDILGTIRIMAQEYENLFTNGNRKVVLKPDNSAQACGVFALQFENSGLSLSAIKQKTVAELSKVQLHHIQADASDEDLKQILNILCFVQDCKAIGKEYEGQNINDIDQEIIAAGAHNLYNNKVLVQPFLEGVKFGDIRVNLVKNASGNFVLAGITFRRNVSKEEAKFTTCLTTEQSVLQPIITLSNLLVGENGLNTIYDLIGKIEQVLDQLNRADLKNQYCEITELGCDFILTGDGKTVKLGEVNHHCPALLPQGEALLDSFTSAFQDLAIPMLDAKYDGGLGITSQIIDNSMELQEYREGEISRTRKRERSPSPSPKSDDSKKKI